jgi:hypothetical protein
MRVNTLKEEDLEGIIGSENWYRHGLVRSITYTDGASTLPTQAVHTGCSVCFRQSCVLLSGTVWLRSNSPALPSNASRQWPLRWMGRD